jgi:hypothetical protein
VGLQGDPDAIIQNIHDLVNILEGKDDPTIKSPEENTKIEGEVDSNTLLEDEDEDLDQDRVGMNDDRLDDFIKNFGDGAKGVKKSFEVKYENDDDDEIFILHEDEGEGDAAMEFGRDDDE